jgi:hypothetical protein
MTAVVELEKISLVKQPIIGYYRLARILKKGKTIKSNSIENLILQVDKILVHKIYGRKCRNSKRNIALERRLAATAEK